MPSLEPLASVSSSVPGRTGWGEEARLTLRELGICPGRANPPEGARAGPCIMVEGAKHMLQRRSQEE